MFLRNHLKALHLIIHTFNDLFPQTTRSQIVGGSRSKTPMRGRIGPRSLYMGGRSKTYFFEIIQFFVTTCCIQTVLKYFLKQTTCSVRHKYAPQRHRVRFRNPLLCVTWCGLSTHLTSQKKSNLTIDILSLGDMPRDPKF